MQQEMPKNKKWPRRFGALALIFTLMAQAVGVFGVSPFEDAPFPAPYAGEADWGNWLRYNATIFNTAVFDRSRAGGAIAVGSDITIANEAGYDLGTAGPVTFNGNNNFSHYDNELLPDGSYQYPTLISSGSNVYSHPQASRSHVYDGNMVMTSAMHSSNDAGGKGFSVENGASQEAGQAELDSWFSEQYTLATNTANLYVLAGNDASHTISYEEYSSGSYVAYGPERFENTQLTVEGVVRDNILFITVDTDADISPPSWWPILELLHVNVPWVMQYDLVVYNFPDVINLTAGGDAFQYEGSIMPANPNVPWNTLNAEQQEERLALGGKLILNFPNAENISFPGALIHGAILAPHARFLANGGTLVGSLIADEYVSENGHSLSPVRLHDITLEIVEEASGSISLRKYMLFNNEPTGTLLAGAQYVLVKIQEDTSELYFNDQGAFVPDMGNAHVYTTLSSGPLLMDEIPVGNYLLREIAAPEGYVLNTTDNTTPTGQLTYYEYPVTVSSSATVNAVRYNQLLHRDVNFKKVDVTTGAGLADAIFLLYREADDYSGVIDIGEFTSDAEGFLTANLPVGSYYAIETSPPPGYTLYAEDAELQFRVVLDNGNLLVKMADGVTDFPQYPIEIRNLPGVPENSVWVRKSYAPDEAGEAPNQGTIHPLQDAAFHLYRFVPEGFFRATPPEADAQILIESAPLPASEETAAPDAAPPSPSVPALQSEVLSSEASETAEIPLHVLMMEPTAGEDSISISEPPPVLASAPEALSSPDSEPTSASETAPASEATSDSVPASSPVSVPDPISVPASELMPESGPVAAPTALLDALGTWEPVTTNGLGDPISILTNALGYYHIDSLPLGIYRLVETQAPQGFALSNPLSDPDFPDVFPNGYAREFQVAEETLFLDVEIFNDPLVADVTLWKTGPSLPEVIGGNPTEISLPGAIFRLERQTGILWEQEQAFTTDANGEILLAALTQGSYRLLELAPPLGYRLSGSGILYFTLSFDVNENPALRVTYDGEEAATDTTPVSLPSTAELTIQVENEPLLQNLEVVKRDNHEEIIEGNRIITYLPGAVFRLQRREIDSNDAWTDYGGSFISDFLYQEASPVLDAYGNHVAAALFEGLVLGEYRVVETDAPPGFSTNSSIEVTLGDGAAGYEIHQFSVTPSTIGADLIHTVPNFAIVQTEDLRLRKVDADDNTLLLDNALFALYACYNTDPLHVHEAFNPAAPISAGCWEYFASDHSDIDGLLFFFELISGDYILWEQQRPAGYPLPPEAGFLWLASVDAEADPSIISILPNNAVTPEMIPPESGDEALYLIPNQQLFPFAFRKVDARNPAVYLPNAEFMLFKEADANMETPLQTVVSDANGLVAFPGLLPGNYRLIESHPPPDFEQPDGYWMVSVEVLTGAIAIQVGSGSWMPAFLDTGEDEDADFLLPNTPSYILPFVGGSGTYAYLLVGSLLIATAVTLAILIFRSKAKKQRHEKLKK